MTAPLSAEKEAFTGSGNHVRGQAHVVMSTSSGLRKGGQRASVDKTGLELELEWTRQSSQLEEFLMKIRPNPDFLYQHIYLSI